jgi:hypothetical protein
MLSGMSAKTDRSDLVRRLARLNAHREQIAKARQELIDRAGAQLDHAQEAHQTASDHLARSPNPFTARYVKARAADCATLRGIALRHEGRGDGEA